MAAAGNKTHPPSSFNEAFDMFSKFGDTNSDGKTITLSQSDKWMKQAKVIDGKNISTTDTAIAFKKFKAHRISIQDYEKFLQDLASQKKTTLEVLKKNLMQCGAPSLNLNMNKTPSKVSESVSRLTDQTKYTGTHKQRFDEQGKGKGIAGRVDLTDKSGYVTGYKNKDSYGKPTPE